MGKKEIAFDYALLRGKIKDEYGTFGAFAKAMNVSCQRMSFLLTNKARWTDAAMWKAARLLGIEDELRIYFFRPRV